jgi:hypothetical protein
MFARQPALLARSFAAVPAAAYTAAMRKGWWSIACVLAIAPSAVAKQVTALLSGDVDVVELIAKERTALVPGGITTRAVAESAAVQKSPMHIKTAGFQIPCSAPLNFESAPYLADDTASDCVLASACVRPVSHCRLRSCRSPVE